MWLRKNDFVGKENEQKFCEEKIILYFKQKNNAFKCKIMKFINNNYFDIECNLSSEFLVLCVLTKKKEKYFQPMNVIQAK